MIKNNIIKSSPLDIRFDRGRHWRAKIGFVILAMEQTIEEDVFRLAPKGVGVHFSRVRMENAVTVDTLEAVGKELAGAAALILPDEKLDVVCYACTSGSLVLGKKKVANELIKGAPNAIATSLITGVIHALEAFKVRQIVVGTPYIEEIKRLRRKNMNNAFQKRTFDFQSRLAEVDVDASVIFDTDNIYYLSAYWGYLGIQFGRPTLLIIPNEGNCSIITPSLEAEMAHKMTWIEDIKEWSDGVDGEWRACLNTIFRNKKNMKIGIEKDKTHPVITEFLKKAYPDITVVDISNILSDMRMVKTVEEIETMRQAGQVSVAMCQGGKEAIAEGVPEYEVALAVIAAGTRKAAEFLTDVGSERLFSPMIHNLQVLQSGGPDLAMVHRRPTVRRLKRGESVYMCFCEMNNFKGFKLGFDRQYWVGEVSKEEAKLYEISLKAQAAALNSIHPGVIAEDVHMAAAQIYKEAGFGLCYRTGRSVGFSLIENPELKNDDKTPLQAGMTFAVDGAVSIPEKTAARVGDSIVVTENGYDYLTPFPKDLQVL